MGKTAVSEYMDYSTVHGMGRLKNTPFKNLYDYNYTEFDKTDISSSFDNDILFDSAEMFKTRMALLDYETLFNYSQPMKEFMLICNFAGSKCTEYSFLHAIRSYDYGICYVFDPSYQLCQDPDSESGCGYVASAGQQYGLELLLNVDQAETVPFVTSSSGVLIIPSDRFNDYIDVNKGVFVPTGFEASVALRKKSTLRVPGMDVDRKRCDDTATISYEECIRDSQEQHILETCGCVQHFYKSGYLNASLSPENTVDPDTGNIPCYTEEHQKDNLLLVRVFLESLSYENVKEEYSYGIVNFVSDIGGQLGLWAGFSVLSVLEVIELILLLFAMRKREAQTAARDATSMTQVQPVKDTDISLRDKV
ncbi:UNC8-like protein [Mya arenaria]|uniref:UNC8-like protein n=1 Tax=Mya arenaria TaxID=6604 RepID=A0ABY7G5B6_MYAAR|nr:UNC8-like protein [Mya arenaria]